MLQPQPNLMFLSLPGEIRDLIYNAVLESETSPPLLEFHREKLNQIPLGLGTNSSRGWKPPPISCAGLLSCNRQVAREVRALIERKRADPKARIKYKLDCIVADEAELYPSWTSISAPAKYLQEVEVDLRLVGTGRINHPYFGSGGGEDMFYDLLDLLDRFFCYGPNMWSTRRTKHVLEVDTLRFNVVCPPGQKAMPDIDGLSSAGKGIVHPKRVFQALVDHFPILMGKEALYGRTLRARVKKIKLCLNHDEREWDLGRIND